MDFSIREARPEDARGIAEVHVRSWQETYVGIVPQDHLDSLSVEKRSAVWSDILQSTDPGIGPDSMTYVACTTAVEVIGFSNGGPTREPMHGFSGELHAVYLLQQYQRHGIGKALFFAIVEALKESGHKDMCLWVLHENPTVDFYAHLGGGYVTDKEIKLGGKPLKEDLYGWHTLPSIQDS